jgi:hypothetical protein
MHSKYFFAKSSYHFFLADANVDRCNGICADARNLFLFFEPPFESGREMIAL